MAAKQEKERRRAARVPVDTELQYRATGMEGYQSCDLLTVSPLAMEIVLDRPLARDTVVNVMIRPTGSRAWNSRAVGTVKRQESVGDRWIHVIVASSTRPFSVRFVDSVVSERAARAPAPTRVPEAAHSYSSFAKWADYREYMVP